ncbi:MAG: peptide deformylase [Succinivibrionaceae bacterium]|nr:peptide deformylase [Succinivibrionaceae bacterium]
MLSIVIFPDPRLRQKCTDVTEFGEQLRSLTDEMFDLMYRTDGVGLAAPQVGISKRLVVIDIPDENGEQGKNRLVLANPVITDREGEPIDSEEGCLSVPDYRATVKRFPRVRVTAQDVEGKPCEYESTDLSAICMQHEIDHLSGRLFIDYLSPLKRDMLRRRYTKWKKEHPNGYEDLEQ